MDFQKFVDTVGMACCVMSVEKTPSGECGAIHIICSNQAYKDTMGPKYYDGMPYQELVPKDNKFEEYCFRAAIGKQRMHAYVETRALNCWTDQTMIPLESDREDLGYCQFIFEFTKTQEAERMDFVSFNTMSRVIRSCFKLKGNGDFEGNVARVLDDVIDFSEAVAGRVMLVDYNKREARIFCERVHGDIWQDRDPDNDVITFDLITTWEKLIGDSNAVIIKNEADMEELGKKNPEWAESMREYGVKSLVLIPLRQGREIIGYLYVVNFNTEKVIEVKELIELISYFLGTEISNYLFFRKLEELSNLDELTGLKNRHAMMKKVQLLDEAAPEHSFGIINIDLNGLKTINDREGHVAGDEKLVRVAGILRHEFRDNDLYRVGGDEFIVLIPDIPEEVFNRRVEAFSEKVPEEYSVSLALGAFWSDGTVTTHEAFVHADRNMYENKMAYYARHPEKKQG